VIEIWDSKEAFEEFLRNRLAPANEALELSGQPTYGQAPA